MKGYQYVKGFTILCPAITFGICLVGVIFNRPLLSLFGLEMCIRDRDALNGYLSVLLSQNPQSVGGSLPEDDFYYLR